MQVVVEGLSELLRKLNDFPLNVRKEASREIQASALSITRNAQRRAPVDTGALRREITYHKDSDMEASIVAGSDHSAYQEFGTGRYVQILQGYEEIAAAARGKGRREVNIHPHPFLFNSFEEEKPRLLKTINDIINRELEK